MSKKYQNHSDQIKQALQDNPARDVLVINDQLIRQKYFAEANQIVNKIESLERNIAKFHASDQIRFDAWYGLTFNDDLLLIERTQNDFRQIIEFHNWVVAASRMMNIDLPEAFILMQEEQHRFKSGTPAEREKIKQDREKRNAFIEADSNPKYDEESSFGQDDSDPETEALDAIFQQLESTLLSLDHEILSTSEQRLQRIAELNPETLELAMQDQQTSFLLFHLGITWGELKHDYFFFLQIWRLFSTVQKTYFADVYEFVSGQSVRQLLLRIGKKSDLNYESENSDDKHDAGGDSSDEDIYFDDEFLKSGQTKKKLKSKMDPLEDEKIKQLYRKLVRKLHPDAQGPETVESWMKRFWQRVQDAYKSKDAETLERLFKLTLLRTNSLNQLTFDEIGQAKSWLQKDLAGLQNEKSQLKRSMAWGFTDLKDFKALSRKIRKEFEATRNSILSEIQKVKNQHQVLQAMAFNENRGSGKKRKMKMRNRKKQRRQKSDSSNW